MKRKDKMDLIRVTSTKVLLKIRSKLENYNSDAGWNEFNSSKMDELYNDVDFELATRGID